MKEREIDEAEVAGITPQEFQALSVSAIGGDPKAQYSLASCYKNGKGVAADLLQAIAWYQKAAEQGYAAAESALGNAYYYGRGVDKNLKTAVEWYKIGRASCRERV